MIRALGLANAGRRERQTERAEEFTARREAIEAAGRRLDELVAERELGAEIVQPLRLRHRDRLKHVEQRNDADPKHTRSIDLHDEIEFLLIEAERKQINDLYRLGKLQDEARRRIERELDLREALLTNVRGDE